MGKIKIAYELAGIKRTEILRDEFNQQEEDEIYCT